MRTKTEWHKPIVLFQGGSKIVGELFYDKNTGQLLENFILVKDSDGNFVAAESMEGIEALAKKDPGRFPKEIKAESGRVYTRVIGNKTIPYAEFEEFIILDIPKHLNPEFPE